MKVIVSTHQGKLYDEVVDYVVVKNTDGEFAILANHVPVVAVITTGYIKLVLDKAELYLAVENGMLEFVNNQVQIIAQNAHIGRDRDSAIKYLQEIQKECLNKNRRENVDYTQKEKEIHDNLRKANVGSL